MTPEFQEKAGRIYSFIDELWSEDDVAENLPSEIVAKIEAAIYIFYLISQDELEDIPRIWRDA